MRTQSMLLGLSLTLLLAACGKSDPSAPPTAADRVKEDLRQAGHDAAQAGRDAADAMRPAVDRAATEAQDAANRLRPAVDRAAETAREAVHDAATRVARNTTTPATFPAAQPQ